MIKNRMFCVMMLSVYLGASTEEKVVHYPIINDLVTPEQVELFKGIDVQWAYHYKFDSCDQKGFQDFLQKVGNNDHAQVAKIAVELMAVCQKAAQKSTQKDYVVKDYVVIDGGFLKTETTDNFNRLNFHIDMPSNFCTLQKKPKKIQDLNTRHTRTLISIQGAGTQIARPTVTEYKEFVPKYCSDPFSFIKDSSRYKFKATEQLLPGQSITFPVFHHKPYAECIHAGPEGVEKSRILMIFDHIQTQPVLKDAAL